MSVPATRSRPSGLKRRLVGGTALVMTTLALLVVDRPDAGAQQQGGLPPAALGAFDGRLSGVEETQRRHTGRIEELEFRMRRLEERVDGLERNLNDRLGRIEQMLQNGAAAGAGDAIGMTPGAAAPADAAQGQPAGQGQGRANGQGQANGQDQAAEVPRSGAVQPLGTITTRRDAAGNSVTTTEAAPSQPTPPPVSGGEAARTRAASIQSEQELYRYGLDLLLKDRDYAGAEATFNELIQRFKQGELVGNAYYWLGETYYAQGQYDRAALTFGEGVTNHDKSSKAPDMVLKLGMSFAALNRKDDACGAYSILNRKFPNAPANIKVLTEREQKKLGCG